MKNNSISKNNVPNEFKQSQLYKDFFNKSQYNEMENEINKTYSIPVNKKYFNEAFIKNFKNNSVENKAVLLNKLIETYQYWEPNFNNSAKIISKKLFNFIYDNKAEIKNIIKKDKNYLFKYKLKILQKFRKYKYSLPSRRNYYYNNNSNNNIPFSYNEKTKKQKSLFFFIERLKSHKNNFIQKIINSNEDREEDKEEIKIKINNAIENFIMNPILILIEIMINSDEENYCDIFTKFGFLNCLKYAHEKDFPWNKETCAIASFYGHLDCLKYAHGNGCPWDEYTCNYAAENGHLDCLKYAHENGCRWGEITSYSAAVSGNLNCIQYLVENNCPWNAYSCNVIKNIECMQYLNEKGIC